MSTVIVKNIWAEDLFEWFTNHVTDSSGDGAAVIVCENYADTATWFDEWWKENIKFPLHPLDIYSFDNYYYWNFHDDNENFIFTNDKDVALFDRDYIFIVEEDCKFSKKDRIIRKIK